jgi:hypothetical protein
VSPVSEGLIKEPLQAPPLGTVRPGPASNVPQSLIERLLQWTLIVITATNILALLLIEVTAEALDRSWPRVEASITSMVDAVRRT